MFFWPTFQAKYSGPFLDIFLNFSPFRGKNSQFSPIFVNFSQFKRVMEDKNARISRPPEGGENNAAGLFSSSNGSTTTERKSFGELFSPQRKTFQTGGRYKNPIKPGKPYLPPKYILCPPFFSGKEKFLTGAGRCMLSSSQVRRGPLGWVLQGISAAGISFAHRCRKVVKWQRGEGERF